jgi:sugar/nucleoside kinase (ribokinase family)
VICALGDLLLDVIVRLDGPIEKDTDTYGRTRVSPGGQAANVASWVAELGGGARFVGKRARDPAGRLLQAELAARGVEVVGPEVSDGTGTVVSVADSEGRRTMLTDRGIAAALRADELERRWFEDCAVLHLPAYSLVRPPIGEAALAAAGLAREAGARISVDLSSTTAIRALGVGRFASLMAGLEPDLVFANEDEAALIPLAAPTVVTKLGARGCRVEDDDGVRELPAREAEVVDTTGAGDAFAAGFLVGGPDLALEASARCVATMGAMPSAPRGSGARAVEDA